MVDWNKHYNWSILRLNSKYRDEYSLFEKRISECNQVAFYEKGGAYWSLNNSSLGSESEYEKAVDLFYNFRSTWSITHPLNPTTSKIPKEVTFRIPEPILLFDPSPQKIASYPEVVFSHLVEEILPSLKGKRRNSSNFIAFAAFDLRLVDEKSLTKLVKELTALKKKVVPKQKKIRCDKALLNRQIETYQMHLEGSLPAEIAEKMQVGRNDRAGAYITDVLRDIARIEGLQAIAPLIPFSFK